MKPVFLSSVRHFLISIVVSVLMVTAWNKIQTSAGAPIYLDLPEIAFSLRPGIRVKTLKLKMCAQLIDKKSMNQFKTHMPEVQSAFLLFIATLDAKDFEDPNFLLTLKRQLQKRAEDITEVKVKDLLITEASLEHGE